MNGGGATLWTMVRRPMWWALVVVLMAIFVAWTEWSVEAVVFGFVAAIAAAYIRHRIARRGPPMSLWAVVRFVPYFARLSVVGGIDVARRAFLPSMPLKPGFVTYRLRIDPRGAAAIFFGCVISLVPGTLCATLEGTETITVHLVDQTSGFEEELARLESRVAALFRESINSDIEPGKQP